MNPKSITQLNNRKADNNAPTSASFVDVVAGLSVALVIIPQSLAYAELAGLPAYIGLFASAVPLIIFSLFASSPYLQTGPVALTSLLTFAGLSAAGLEPETETYIAAATVLALLVGLMRLFLGFFKLGWLAYLVSRPVLLGFTNAAAIIILASQLPKALGTDQVIPDGSTLGNALWSMSRPGDWSPQAIALAAITVCLLLFSKHIHRLFPGVLVAAGFGLLATQVGYDGSIIGDSPIEAGLPPLTAALDWALVPELLLAAAVIALVGFAEPSAIARVFAREEKQSWDVNQELIASGFANAAAGFTGAYPVGGSFSRSSLNKLAGAKSRWSGAVTGLAVCAFLFVATILNDLPQAILGGVVVGAAIKLIKPREILELLKQSKPQGVLSIITFCLTLLSAPNIHLALIAAVVLTFAVQFLEPAALEATRDGNRFNLTGFCWLGSERKFRNLIGKATNSANIDKPITFNATAITDFDQEFETKLVKRAEEAGRKVSFEH